MRADRPAYPPLAKRIVCYLDSRSDSSMTSDLMMNTIMTMTQRDGESENAMNGEAKREMKMRA